MNCGELAATLEKTLIHERGPRWFHDANRHAKECPACSRLLELHQVEDRLTRLSAVEPSCLVLETVMSRITQREPDAVSSSAEFSYESFKYAAICVGALLLTGAYLVPPGGRHWLSNLLPGPRLLGAFGFSAYLGRHPFWTIHLAGLAALMIVFGLAVPDRTVREKD